MSHPPVAALTSVHLDSALLLVPYGPLAEGLTDCCPACQAACEPVAVAAESNGEEYDKHYGAYFCTYCSFRWLCYWDGQLTQRLVQEARDRDY